MRRSANFIWKVGAPTTSSISAALDVPSAAHEFVAPVTSLADTITTDFPPDSVAVARLAGTKSGQATWAYDDRFLSEWDPSVPRRLAFARDLLQSTNEYLGNSDTASLFVWRNNRLYKKEDIDEYDEAQAFPVEGFYIPFPDPVKLSAVVRLSEQDFRFMSCGVWQGGRSEPKKFADVFLTCISKDPSHSFFNSHYQNVVGNLKMILRAGRATTDDEETESVALKTVMRFRHKLFDDVNCNTKPLKCMLPSLLLIMRLDKGREFTIAKWPAYHTVARLALWQMQDTHRVNYLPAFDVDNNLIKPKYYTKHLRRALVEIHFTIEHSEVPAEGGLCDNFDFDVALMYVLEAAPTLENPYLTRNLLIRSAGRFWSSPVPVKKFRL